MYTVEKYSSPGWEKSFESKDEAIDELRSRICGGCLSGEDGTWIDSEGNEFFEESSVRTVDTEYDGIKYECRDIATLLSTSCGCEYGFYIDGKPYYEYWL